MSTYYLSRGKETVTTTEDELLTQLRDGTLSGEDLICQEGWPQWRPLGAVFPVTVPPKPKALPPPIATAPVAVSAMPPVQRPEITLAISERPAAVKLQQRAEQFLTTDEFVIATAAQQLVVMSPDGVVLTNRRMMLVSPQFGGLKLSFQDWLWQDIANVHIAEGLLGSSITVHSMNRTVRMVERLDKVEARAVYRIAQKMEEIIRVGRHHLEMERLRAGSALLRH